MSSSSSMDMSSMTMATSMVTTTASSTMTAALTTTTSTDFTPGTYDTKGRYIPTSDEMMEYQSTREPWAWNVIYGYYALAMLSSVLITFSFANALWRLRIRYKSPARYISSMSKATALVRLLSYPQLYRPSLVWIWAFGPLGPNLVLFAGLLFSSFITWINEYYYRLPYYGSPPLCLRSEWIAMASLPFIFVLGAKRNLISLLTGVSHERLQIFHQGLAFNFVYMSLIHALSTIYVAHRDEGFVYSMNMYPLLYGSGYLALGAFLVSFFWALPVFRKLFYETFWFIHVFVALLGLAALFWHGYKTLDSDDYMIATIVFFLGSVFWRLVMIALHNPSLHVATVEPLGHDAIKLYIPTHTIRWSPGQHVFLRFTGASPLEAHPFTIASIDEIVGVKNGINIRRMDFLIRPQSGFTKKLCDKIQAKDKATYGVLVDGPYGSGGSELHAFDEVMIAVGGSGVTWGLAILKDLIRNVAVAGRVVRRVNMIWCVRSTDAIQWFADDLRTIAGNRTNSVDVSISIHVTDTGALDKTTTLSSEAASTSPSSSGSPCEQEKPDFLKGKGKGAATARTSPHHGLVVTYGRPDLSALVLDFVAGASGSVAVASCGPGGFSPAVSNAVASVQVGIIRSRYPRITEAFLKSESYDW